MIKGREEESLQALAKLHANGNTEDDFVRGEYQEMKQKVIEEANVNKGWALVSRSHLPKSHVLSTDL